MKRKIAAILAADIAGYSRLVAEDEEETLHRLETCRAVFSDFVARHGGRIFNNAGDATLAEFQSAVDAIRCAVDVQESVRTRNLGYAPSRHLSYRIGITIGDVVERDRDLLGDGVNIASRLEGCAPPGGICISRAVFEAVTNKVSLKFEDLGPLQLKNIPERVHAYTVTLDQPARTPVLSAAAWRAFGLAAVFMMAAAATGTYLVTRSLSPLETALENGGSPQTVAVGEGKSVESQTAFEPPSVPAQEMEQEKEQVQEQKEKEQEQKEPAVTNDETCMKYLPSIGTTVAVPCESARDAGKSGESTAKLQPDRHNLRITLGLHPVANSVPRGWLGIKVIDLPPSLPMVIDLSPQGVFINDVVSDGPAARAGIRAGDIIVTIDGREPKTARSLAGITWNLAPDTEVALEIARVGQGSADLMRALRERADTGSTHAMVALGALLSTTIGGVEDDAEAARWYRKAAELGNAGAISTLGYLYQHGSGVTKDEAEAVRWYRKAAELGEPTAMTRLANAYSDGQGVVKDEAEAARWYRKAADLGFPVAMHNLGVYYRDGRGVAKNEAEGAGWFRKAAELGEPTSMTALGVLYRDGRGVAKDHAEAVRWFRKGAELGEASSMNALGELYRDGKGVAKEHAEAVRWFRKGAESGSSASMTLLGVQFANGWGVDKDPEQAAAWIFQALQKGDSSAVELLRKQSDAGPTAFHSVLQRRLKEAGVFDGPIDGVVGPGTLRAVNELASRKPQ